MESPVLTRLGFARPPRLFPIGRPLWCTKPIHPDDQQRPPKTDFTEYLDLLPKNKVDAVKRKREEMMDCEDLDLDDNPVPKSPTTPRTKMTLLRPDLSPPACVTARRSLSSLSVTNPPQEGKKTQDSDSDAESECSNSAKSESSEDSAKLKRSAATRLLSIPLCSELGHRVRKHVEAKKEILRKQLTAEGDKAAEIASNYEKYCHTPRKSEHYSRLRTRAETEYPVTFNKRRDISDWKCHKYKFNWKDHVEFWKTVKSGLNTRARRLKSRTKKCTVVLKELTNNDFKMWLVDYQQPKVLMKVLSPAEIERWSKKHNSDSYMIPMILDSPQFPKTPEHIADADLKQLLGLRNQQDVKVPLHERTLSLSQCVSEDVSAEVTQQKAVVYKTLLKAMDRTAGETALTPPDTPPEHGLNSGPDAEPCDTPKGDSNCSAARKLLSTPDDAGSTRCPAVRKLLSTPCKNSENLQIEPITKLEPMVFYAGGNGNTDKHESGMDQHCSVKKWGATGGILVPLVQSSTDNDEKPADDFFVTVNDADSSSTESPSPGSGHGRSKRRKIVKVMPLTFSPRKNSLSSTSSDVSETGSRENLPPKKASPSKKKINKPTKRKTKLSKVVRKLNAVKKTTVKCKTAFGRKNTTSVSRASKKVLIKKSTLKGKLPKKTKRGRPRKIAQKSVDDESEEDTEVILSDRSSLASDSPSKTDFDMLDAKPRGVKRKHKQNAMQMSSVASKKVNSNSPLKKCPDDNRLIMFKCHLCGVELHAKLGERDFIAEHYQDTHDVHNIRLRENVSNDGHRTVSVIQDVPKTPPVDEKQKQSPFNAPINPHKKSKGPGRPKKNGQLTKKSRSLLSKQNALNGTFPAKKGPLQGRPCSHKNGHKVTVVA